ncbi:MAG: hypothetical protein AB1414_05540 [bacterium]
MKIKWIIAVLWLLIHPATLFSQTLPPPGSWTITSDYGPRALAGHYWHGGIDYGGPYGASIQAVEGGDIDRIRYLEGGWNLRIQSSLGNWEYIHIFNDGPLPITLGNWELRNATLVNPNNPNDVTYSNVIILWSGTMATEVLSEEGYSGRWIRNPNGSYIRETTGATATTRASIEQSEAIAPVGNSGGVPTHLHLEYNNGDDNPLLHVNHNPSNYSITFQHPTDADDGVSDGRITVFHNRPITERINTRINTTTGLDLNRVRFFIDLIDDNHRLWRSCYGGRNDDEGRVNTRNPMG